ncbi:MAG: hypothetical protein EOM35_07050 [Negativicutes bacterium]|nr:hypothetical protein [Negativicutes bacterium]
MGAAHRCSFWETDLFEQIHKRYGDVGDDSLLFTTFEEMYEHWFVRKNAKIRVEQIAGGLTLDVVQPVLEGFRYNNTTLVVEGLTNPSQYEVTCTDAIGLSYSVKGTKLIININPDVSVLDIAKTYTDAFVEDSNKPYAYEDALYFVSQLKPQLKQPLLDRINAVATPPGIVRSLFVDPVTKNPVSTISVPYAELEILLNQSIYTDFILISEHSDFTDPFEVRIDANVEKKYINYKFKNASVGLKTVYIKGVNKFGEGNVVQAEVTYVAPDPVVLNSIQIENGDATTTKKTVSVTLDYTGDLAEYKIAE